MSDFTTDGTSLGIRSRVRYMTSTALLSAVAFVLQFFEFSIPLMPAFIKMDISDLPELIGAFALGPVSGVLVALIKNLIHLPLSHTGGVGELCNFLLGACFALTAGLIYKHNKTKRARSWLPSQALCAWRCCPSRLTMASPIRSTS